MTTIAYRNGIMAGDTQVEWTTEAGGIYSGYECKVFRFEQGLIATSGTANQGWDYMEWFKNGMRGAAEFTDDAEEMDFHALLVLNDGSIWKSEDGERICRQLQNFAAIGSGYSTAMGAMEMGASAVKAVEVATKYDPATGGDIITVELEGS